MLSAIMGLPGGGEMIIIGVLFLFLIFGVKKLPETARAIGSSFVEFKRGFREVKEPLEEARDNVNEAVGDVQKTVKDAAKDITT